MFHSGRTFLGTLCLVLCTFFAAQSGVFISTFLRSQSTKTKLQRPSFCNKKAATRAASCCSFCCGSLNDYYSFILIEISQHHFDDFALLGRYVFANVIGLNRQFAVLVSAVDQ